MLRRFDRRRRVMLPPSATARNASSVAAGARRFVLDTIGAATLRTCPPSARDARSVDAGES
jgi:hypothetical protein